MSDIIEKLAKIREKQESAEKIGSFAEAQIFAAKLEELLIKYNLSLSEIEYDKQFGDEQIEYHHLSWENYGLKTTKRRCGWLERLASIVTKYNGCKILCTKGTNKLIIVGKESNAAIAEYMIGVLAKSCYDMMCVEYNKIYRKLQLEGRTSEMKDWTQCFYFGFATGIKEKLKNEMEKTKQSEQTENSTALVRLDKNIKEVDDFLQGRTNKASRLSGFRTNEQGIKSGMESAEKVNIKKGINGKEQTYLS